MEEKVEVMEMNDNAANVIDIDDVGLDDSGMSTVGKLAIGLGILTGVGAGIAFLKRDKIKEWSNNRKIKKLEDQGFIVLRHPAESNKEVLDGEFQDDEEDN